MSKIASAVGISVTGRARREDDQRGASNAPEIQSAMENAVRISQQYGESDPAAVKSRMMEARKRAKGKT